MGVIAGGMLIVDSGVCARKTVDEGIGRPDRLREREICIFDRRGHGHYEP